MMFNRKELNPRVHFEVIFEKLDMFLNVSYANYIPECDLEPFRLLVEDMKHSIELWNFDSLHNQIDEILNIIKYHDPECKLAEAIHIPLRHFLIFLFIGDMLPYAFDFLLNNKSKLSIKPEEIKGIFTSVYNCPSVHNF